MPPFVILSSGQTGVERGALLCAHTLGIPVAGFMRSNGRDELGPVPEELAAHLVRCAATGPRRARDANVDHASCLVVAVPDATHPRSITGMKQVMDRARSRRLPIFTCEPASDLNDLARAIMAKRASALWHVYITGPRATRWRDGEEFGRSIVRALASHLIGTDNLIVA